MKMNQYWEECYYPSTYQLRESTRIGYMSAYRKHIKPTFGEVDINTITPYQIEVWLSNIPTAGAARKAYAVFRAMIRKAVKWELVDKDPTAAGIQLPKKNTYCPQVLSNEEVTKLLNAFKEHELEAFVICSVTLGLRRGEACGLTWERIDFTTGAVSIEESRQYVNGRTVSLDPKTEKSRRVVYLPHFALERLKQIKGTGYIATDKNPEAIAKLYKSHCEKNNIKYVPLTNLRHSYATNSIAAGNSIFVVSKTLGHTSINTTAKYYLVADEKMLREAQDKWENYILSA